MRSRWLDWTARTGSVGFDGGPAANNFINQTLDAKLTPAADLPCVVVLEKSRQTEPSKPSKGFDGFEGELLFRSVAGLNHDSSIYRAKLVEAIRKINEFDCTAGMIHWISNLHPGLYDQLTSEIPDLIDQLWNEGAALGEFDDALNRLVSTYAWASELYRNRPATG